MNAGISAFFSIVRSGLDRILHPKVFWLLLLAVSIGPAAYSVFHQHTRPATLWFPGFHGNDAAKQEVVAELRFIVSDGDVSNDAVRMLDELFLGALKAEHESLTIPGSYVQAALFRKNILYIDLSTEIFFGRLMSSGVYRAPQFQPATVLALADKTLAWNFPGKRIVITIGGYEPIW